MKHKLFAIVANLVVGATSLFSASAIVNTPIANAQIVASPNQITEFTLLQGNPSWQQAILNRMVQSSFKFNPDGSFEFHSPGRTDVFPLKGQYERKGNTLYFTAFGSNGSSAESALSGNIDLETSIANIEVVSGAGLSACVITGCSGVNSNSHYKVQMIVQ
jgi:hypothetical protein